MVFEDRIVPVVKETVRAVKHEEAWAKGNAKEPLQEEEDGGEEHSFAGKGDEAVLIIIIQVFGVERLPLFSSGSF